MNIVSPVFLVSPLRSGSTLLKLILDSHPDITNPGECDFLFDMIDDEGNQPTNEEYLLYLSIDRIFNQMKLKIDKDLSYLKQVFFIIEQFPKTEVLSMTVHRNFDKITSIFPNARFLHLLRDPRDVARSCIGMGWAGHVYYGVDVWLQAEKTWDKLKSTLEQDQYLEIKYEDLLVDIESGLTEICNFLGVKYTETMFDYANSTTYKLPDKNLCYQWKSKYSKRELQLVESKISKILLQRGYELSGNPMIKPNIVELTMLIIKNYIFRKTYQIKKYGLSLFIQNYLARKFGIKSWKNICQKRINLIDLSNLK